MIEEGRSLTLAAAVTEILSAFDSLEETKRAPESHGGHYLSRWRFERLRMALRSAGAGPAATLPEIPSAPNDVGGEALRRYTEARAALEGDVYGSPEALGRMDRVVIAADAMAAALRAQGGAPTALPASVETVLRRARWMAEALPTGEGTFEAMTKVIEAIREHDAALSPDSRTPNQDRAP